MNVYKAETTCPTCGKQNDLCSALFDQSSPEPGHFSICLDCQGLHVFDEQLKLRVPTEDELAGAPLLLLSHVQRLLRQAKASTR